MVVLTPLYLSAVEKGISDGSCCAPFSSFCILLIPWWESPDGSFCSFPSYFYSVLAQFCVFKRSLHSFWDVFYVFQMLEVAKELICCFD